MLFYLIFATASASSSYSISYESMMQDLHCTNFQATLGLSLYVIGYGIAPLIFSSFSEVWLLPVSCHPWALNNIWVSGVRQTTHLPSVIRFVFASWSYECIVSGRKLHCCHKRSSCLAGHQTYKPWLCRVHYKESLAQLVFVCLQGPSLTFGSRMSKVWYLWLLTYW
jgi:hypothetical protein